MQKMMDANLSSIYRVLIMENDMNSANKQDAYTACENEIILDDFQTNILTVINKTPNSRK